MAASRNQRSSSVLVLLPFRGMWPRVSGAFGADERAQVAFLYGGVFNSERWIPAVPDVELWSGATIQSETWSEQSVHSESWTPRTAQSETWTERTQQSESWTNIPDA